MSGSQVKKFRERLGMSQAELAHELGIDRTTVNRWESGIIGVSDSRVKMLKMIAKLKGAA